MAEPVGEKAFGTEVHELVDLWHLLEKLGRAAAVIHGSGSADEVVEGLEAEIVTGAKVI